MTDVMWAQPSGERILLADRYATAEFITAIYDFDHVNIGPLSVRSIGNTLVVAGHGIEIVLVGGRRRPIPLRRPLAITRWIEAPIARAAMGVDTFGTSPTGAREWYQAKGWRWVVGGNAWIDQRDLGAPGTPRPPMAVGFSEPPRRPSIVSVKVTIDLPQHVRIPK